MGLNTSHMAKVELTLELGEEGSVLYLLLQFLLLQSCPQHHSGTGWVCDPSAGRSCRTEPGKLLLKCSCCALGLGVLLPPVLLSFPKAAITSARLFLWVRFGPQK